MKVLKDSDFILRIGQEMPVSTKLSKGDYVFCIDMGKADLQNGDILAVAFAWSEYEAILCKLFCTNTTALLFPLHDSRKVYRCDQGLLIGKAVGFIHSFKEARE